jgi:hypothetical protein
MIIMNFSAIAQVVFLMTSIDVGCKCLLAYFNAQKMEINIYG